MQLTSTSFAELSPIPIFFLETSTYTAELFSGKFVYCITMNPTRTTLILMTVINFVSLKTPATR